MNHQYLPIGILRTCFTEKFGVPRQSMMISEACGVLKLNADENYKRALAHLSEFSHIWLVFVFHKNADEPWRATVRPPRVDAPRKVGVFATRSPHRPNPIGLSAVKLDRIDVEAEGGIELHLSGVDLMDGTPVLDIKPYLPYADIIADANSGWAEGQITRYEVSFTPESLAVIEAGAEDHPRLQALITQMLEWDPRPTSQRRAMPIETAENNGRCFAFRVLDYDVKWKINSGSILVLAVEKIK